MKYSNVPFITLLCFIACSCNLDLTKEKKKNSSKKLDGEVKQYRKDGSLKTVLHYKNKKKNGVAKSYYKTGVLRQEIFYVDDIKHGEVKTYYENGNLFRITPYDTGTIHGIQKRFREDGSLFSEMPFHQGNPTIGLKEYTSKGKVKKRYPKIEIEPLDKMLTQNQYTLRIKMSDGTKKVKYYIGKLTDGRWIGPDAERFMAQKPGVLELTYTLPPGSFIMEDVNIIAEVTTPYKNTYITERNYQLAIENRGY